MINFITHLVNIDKYIAKWNSEVNAMFLKIASLDQLYSPRTYSMGVFIGILMANGRKCSLSFPAYTISLDNKLIFQLSISLMVKK